MLNKISLNRKYVKKKKNTKYKKKCEKQKHPLKVKIQKHDALRIPEKSEGVALFVTTH